jgi:hypothetical protein
MEKSEANRRYYAAHRDRIILRESELRPSTILELLDCLGELELHSADKRFERLRQLYRDLTGDEPPTRLGNLND